ncbi:hypothetical protein LINPERHAP1_LOCUS8240 [Linum perenne]
MSLLIRKLHSRESFLSLQKEGCCCEIPSVVIHPRGTAISGENNFKGSGPCHDHSSFD